MLTKAGIEAIDGEGPGPVQRLPALRPRVNTMPSQWPRFRLIERLFVVLVMEEVEGVAGFGHGSITLPSTAPAMSDRSATRSTQSVLSFLGLTPIGPMDART